MIPLFSSSLANAGFDFTTPISRVLDRSWFVLGEEVKGFENEFAQYCGVDHCVGLANGSDALELALRALGIKAGDTVATVANAGFYSSFAIHAVGATPLYVDVDPQTLTLSPASLAHAMAQTPSAVIVTHLYGQLADMDSILEVANAHGVPVIEDCAQSHGARRQGKVAGSWGVMGCFSFYPTKNLGALGDGGAVVSNDAQLAERVRQLRQYGWSKKYHVTLQGGRNSRLDELQAAVLRIKLPQLDHCNAQRRAIATRYNQAFSGLPVKLPASLGDDYVAHLYVMRTIDRKEFSAYLSEAGVGNDVHYPVPDYQQPVYNGNAGLHLPVTDEACRTAISLPCFPGMTSAQVDEVIAAVQGFFANGASSC